MPLLLQMTLTAVLVILCAFLVPLLIQARRTARAIQILAESAREDLRSMSGDLRLCREHLDRVADQVEASLSLPAAIGRVAAHFLDRTAAPWIEALVTGLKIAIDFFRRPSEAAPAKENSDER